MGGTFDQAHALWFQKHLNESTGDRRQLLERRWKKEQQYGEDAAEKRFLRDVWWPLYGSFEMMHPEYEIVDFLGRSRFLDHAWIHYPVLGDIEVDGYGPHLKHISRWNFADERRRDAGLQILGWNVLRFSFDDVKDNPLVCQHLLKHWMDGLTPRSQADSWREQIIRLGTYHSPFSLPDVMRVLGISDKTALRLIRGLVFQQVLVPSSKGMKRIHDYSLHENYLRNGAVVIKPDSM